MSTGEDNIDDGCALQGARVCILGASDFATDARLRKQATSLTEAGARVTAVGVGSSLAPDLASARYSVKMLEPSSFKYPRLGQEDVWWPLRVAVNLTYTKAMTWWFLRRRAAPVYAEEGRLVSAALQSEPDVVHAYNIRTLPAAVRVKEMTGARVIYDCRDLYTDVEYVDERTRQKYRSAETQLIREADAVFTVSEPFADILESRHHIARPIPIYNGPATVMPLSLPPGNPVRLFFQGAYRPNRNLASLIDAMGLLRGRATLTLQGFGDMEDGLRNQVAALGLEDTVTFIPPVNPLDVVRSASEYDVGVICYRGDTLNLQSTVPYKLMDYLGGGLAVAASDLPGHRSVLQDSGAGILIDPSSPQTIAEGIAGLVDHPERIGAMKRAALELAREYEWKTQAARLVEVYESLWAKNQDSEA